MGYNTRYKIEYTGPFDEDIESAFETIEYGYNPFEEQTKWYSHTKDMKSLSLVHPTVLFVLRGYGDDNEDMWIEYYKNGKMQRCDAIITFPEFDPLELK